MAELARLKPDPIPVLHLLPEVRAEGALKALYEDTKQVLQVPWMGVIAMAHAHYRLYYEALWRGFRPLFASAPFVEACRALRADVEARVAALDPPPIAVRLAAAGYAPGEIDRIRDVIEVFSHGNFAYCVMATLSRLALEGAPLPAPAPAEPFTGRHAPDVEVPFVLMEPHHADAPTRAVYEDVMATLGLPFVNTDYRALARWPSYFARAWPDLKRAVADPAYEPMVAETHAALVAAALALPNPAHVTGEALRAAAAEDAPGDEVLAMARLFQWLLPGLVTNVAFLRHQLAPI